MCELKNLFIEQVKNTAKTRKKVSLWNENCDLYCVKRLSIDERGRNAQEFFQKIFSKKFRTQGDNEKTGDWDIKIENWRVEVKSATIDCNGKFQHDGVRMTNNYDFIFFLDISTNDIYFSCCHYNSIPFDSLHERGNDSIRTKRVTGNGFKWDFKYDEKNKKKPKYNGLVKTIDDVITIFEKCLNESKSYSNVEY